MSKLYGRDVLIVEDHPLILFEIADALRRVGAKPTMAATFEQALTVLEHDNLAAAIVDHALLNGHSSVLCEKLEDRNIPFVIHSQHNDLNVSCANAPFVEKPATTEKLISTVENLLPT
jgi:DNA-binding NtrC family response regulator